MPPFPYPAALLTDLYQLTMAFAHWHTGRREQEGVFHAFFRSNPFHGGYAVASGLGPLVEALASLRFGTEELAYLAGITGADGRPLFPRAFLDYLGEMTFACDVDAVPEGTVVFPHEPVARVSGPIVQAQLIETLLLTLLNFHTLIATKAARISHAARGDQVIEFGLRRAQGVDGGLAASRAAYVGGCAGTSNVLAGMRYGIPVRGTHAHSWVMAWGDELAAFEAYADALPNNCVFLVDTYDTIQGVRHAVEVGRRLRARGHELLGVRLDSGDLAELSVRAREILDEGGFPGATILASNDLDEYVITSLKEQGAAITVWGVGTRLVTAYDQPALGGVYKLSAIRDRPEAPWQHRIKLSEQPAKVSTPGVLQVRRYRAGGRFAGDVVYDQGAPPGDGAPVSAIDPFDITRRLTHGAHMPYEDLLVPVFRAGRLVYEAPPLPAIRQRTFDQLALLPPATRRFLNPQPYPVGLERGLHEMKTELILKARRQGQEQHA